MSKKRILIAGNLGSGLTTRTELIVALLKKCDVYLCSPFDERSKSFFEGLGCVCIDTPMSRRGMNPFSDSKLFLQYVYILNRYKIDFIFSYTIKPNLYCGLAALLLRKKYIPTINGLGTAFQKESFLQKMLLRFFSFVCHRAKHVFLQNSAIEDFFCTNRILSQKNKNYSVIKGSGVNLVKFIPIPYPQLANNTIKFLYIGRMMNEKGIPELMEAAHRILKDFPEAEFHFIGWCESGYAERMEQWQQQQGIFYHGSQGDVRPFLEQAHCLVHPTYHEGMSNVCLEAAACARPIIASHISGCKEIFDEGVSGFGIEPRNIDSLEAILRKFIALPHDKKIAMGLAGRAKIEKEFDRDIVVKEYLEIIGDICLNKK